MRYNILSIDSQPTLRTGIKHSISDCLKVFYEASDSQHGISIIKSQRVDLVILELKLCGGDGVDLIKFIRKEFPKLKIFVYSQYSQLNLLIAIFKLGICGYLNKDSALSCEVIEKIMDNKYNQIRPSAVIHRTVAFSRQEIKIIALAATGNSNEEISYIIGIKKSTVQAYRKRMLKKYKFKTVHELIDFAHRIGKL